MEEILKNITKSNEINKNSTLFIKSRNLKPYYSKNLLKKVSINNLPLNLDLGTVYLIKKNIILESYSWCDYNYSFSSEINYKQPKWLNKITVYNNHENDPYNIEKYIFNEETNDSIISFSPSSLKKYVVSLINYGFELYISK